MRYRPLLGVLLLTCVLAPLTGCVASPSLTSITVSPGTMNFGGSGLTAQLRAVGFYTHPGHPAETKDITDSVTWSSSAVQCVTVDNTGMITSGGNICSNILVTASAPGFNGFISGTMTVNVTQPTGGGGGATGGTDVTSISLIPPSQTVPAPGDTAQFIAIGTTSSGATVSLDGYAAWTSSSPQIATIGSATGLATAVSQGSVTITALYTNADGTAATGTGTFTVQGGASSEAYTAITIIPSSQSLSASGQTGQFIALGTAGGTGLVEDVTNSSQVTWSSSIPSIATVSTYPASPAGLAAGASQGTTTITAILKNPDGSVVESAATVQVTLTAAPEPLLSLAIIPASITVGNLQDTGQFLAIGTYSTPPTVRDLTNSVTWLSSAPGVFPVNTNGTGQPLPGADAGVVTAYGSGGAVIIAEATDPTTGSIQTATATFNCPLILPTLTTAGSCYPGSEAPALLATLTVYNEGLNNSNWLVTAPSATGTPDVLHCGPGSSAAGFGGSVCVASYPVGSTVTLTAPAGAGLFGGWSYNCTPTGTVTAAGPNSCTVTLTTNDTVGAVFN
ncbi:MAG: Ig-like domain-containing protein [Terracidiphilus sp.]